MNIYQKVSKKFSDTFHTYSPLLTLNHKVECPFCGWSGSEFLPNGVEVRKNARCPKCDSLERHRLYYLYLKEVIPVDREIKVLHFAPEKIIKKLFTSFPKVKYLSADLKPGKAMVAEDITQTSFGNDVFDLIFCSHVLEHVPDDHKAMLELHRILKPDGFAILQVPVKTFFNGRSINKTFEDFSITEPKEREKAFGQHDHVRVYGRDFKDRLEKAGLNVNVINYIKRLGQEKAMKFALLPEIYPIEETEGWIYHCTK